MPLLPNPSIIAWAERIADNQPPHPDDRSAEAQILSNNEFGNADRLNHISDLVPGFEWSLENGAYMFTCYNSNNCRSIDQTTLFPDNHEFITVICDHCGIEKVVPVYCGNRFCQTCASPRQIRVHDRINWLIKHRKKHKGSMLKHLTLTIRNEDDLPSMVRHLVKSFRRLRQRKLFKSLIHGGVFVIELTNKDNGWHAHIHAIVQSDRIEWSELRNMWIKCSGGSSGVYIQNIPPVEAVRYLTKYIAQCDLSIDNQLIATDTLKNYRLFNPFGEWYAINKEYVRPVTLCSACNSPSSYSLLFEYAFALDKFRNSS